MTDDKIGDAFVRLYHARDEMEAAIKQAMDALWDSKHKLADKGYKAAEDVYHDFDHAKNLQTAIDTLEEMI